MDLKLLAGSLASFESPVIYPALAQALRVAAAEMEGRLSAAEMEAWAQEAWAIAQSGYRAWEAAIAYCQVSPAVLPHLDVASFIGWTRLGRGLAQTSATLASAYFRASPQALRHLSPQELPAWAEMGRGLYGTGTRQAEGLACRFFEASPQLMGELGLAPAQDFTRRLSGLSRHSPQAAVELLALASSPFARQLPPEDGRRILELAATLAESNWPAAQQVLAEAAQALAPLEHEHRRRLLALARRAASFSAQEGAALLLVGAQALAQAEAARRGEVLRLAEETLALSPPAAVEFLRAAPGLLARYGPGALAAWARAGGNRLRQNGAAGLAHFRRQSKRGEEMLASLAGGVSLEEGREILRRYCQALTGRRVKVLDTAELARKGLGWTTTDLPTTDGETIFLPPMVAAFSTKEANFAHYKVLATHQAAHLEFGTFAFSFGRQARLFSDRRPALAARRPKAQNHTDFERFFDLFADRRLAKDIFTIVEDSRVDRRVIREYRGLAQAYGRAQRRALAARPPLAALPLRRAAVEGLLRLSLGEDGLRAPPPLARPLAAAAIFLRLVQSPAATVEDSAEAALRLYRLIRPLPKRRVGPAEALVPLEVGEGMALAEVEEGFLALDAAPAAGMGEEGPDEKSPDPPDFRGAFQPELVQAIMRLRSDGGSGPPLSPEALKALLEKGAEIEIAGLAEGEVDPSLGLFVTNLMGAYAKRGEGRGERGQGKGAKQALPGPQSLDPDDDALWFTYDEWDFRAQDYRPQWCRLKEQVLREGAADFYPRVLVEKAALAAELKRQFELLRPERFKKIKRLPDGEDIDLDAAIERVVDKRAGRSPSEKVYWRRRKGERDVAAALLLDMSASTDEELCPPERPAPNWDDPEYIPRPKGRRIIDLAKESFVLLVEGLEAVGDAYGIYGFSGYGRDDVEFFVIKDLDEGYSERVARRIEAIAPLRSTRMGAAIRHSIAKLMGRAARLRLLFLVSDGYPQDHDYYGEDRLEREYAVHDTRKALLEAKEQGIIPFCLTVDKAGHDYLRAMCGDIGYEVVNELEDLPRRLAELYRRLTL